MSIINEINELAISTRLLRLSEAIRKDATLVYKEYGIDFESKWFPILYVLLKKSPLSVIELADEIGYAHTSVIALAKEMEKKKLLKSEINKTDGRKRMLSLTPNALKMKFELQPLWDDLKKVAKTISENKNNLMKAMEETEAALSKESFYDRYKNLKASRISTRSNKKKEYKIVNTTEHDLDFIFWMFEEAIVYQKRKNYPVWNGYDRDVLRKEAREKKQFKIVIQNKIAFAFSVVYSDHLIWREREKGDAVYLHRIVVNPEYKGQKLYGKLLKWIKNHARKKNLKFIRMDTWADNPNIIDYYKSFGFEFIENYKTPNILELPIPHRNLNLALLELNISKL